MGQWKDLKLPSAQPEAQPLLATTVPERVLLQGLPLGKNIKSPEGSCDTISVLSCKDDTRNH